ncbi:MAG: GNAT family N-acetyltransferase, partial [Sulfuricella sp.]|nr:GNAT family N-acetyltransferase [Sulfuricella sp.]
VSDQWQHKAIGHKLMGSLIDAARDRGLKTMEGEVLAKNTSMLKLVATLGFSIATSEEDPAIKRVTRSL